MNTDNLASPQSHLRQRRIDRFKRWAGHIPAYLILGLWSLFTLFVILWVMLSSLKTTRELFANVWALPTKLHFENYVKALFAADLEVYFLNSLAVVLTSVLVILALSAPAAYVLSRKKFRGSNLITLAFIAGIGIPLPLLFIPLFIIMTEFKINNTLFGLGTLFVAVSLPFTIFILTSFFALPAGGTGRGGDHRRRQRLPGLLPGDAAAGHAGIDHRRDLQFHRTVERIPAGVGVHQRPR